MNGRTQESSFYEVLEVGANATTEEIEASYQRIVSYLGPEALAVYSVMTDEELAQRRAQLDEAYRILKDPARREAYDRARESGSSYPQVLVPDTRSDATMSVGIVRTEADENLPVLDVDAIFRGGDHALVTTASTAADVAAPAEGDATQETVTDTPELPGVATSSHQMTTRAADSAASTTAASALAALAPAAAAAATAASRQSTGHEIDSIRAAGAPAAPAERPRRSDEPNRGAGRGATLAAGAEPDRDAGRAPGAASASAMATGPVGAPAAAPTHGVSAGSRPMPTRRGLEPTRPAGPNHVLPGNRRLYPSPAIEITADTEFSGALLRRLRESCSASIDEVASITKVRRAYLAAIEEHDFAALPAPVYVRGFVTEYARVLGLETQCVAQSYMAVYRRYRGEGT